MNDRPILFSGPMVRALLAGTKTQTRRVIARLDHSDEYLGMGLGGYCFGEVGHDPYNVLRCPYGQPGDRLWVKETWSTVKGNGIRTVYRADGDRPTGLNGEPVWGKMVWTSPRFMRRGASRITLELTDVRVQRVQDITGYDVRAEGIQLPLCGCEICRQSAIMCTADEGSHLEEFAALWDTINAKRAPWATNPWVWVLAFRMLP